MTLPGEVGTGYWDDGQPAARGWSAPGSVGHEAGLHQRTRRSQAAGRLAAERRRHLRSVAGEPGVAFRDEPGEVEAATGPFFAQVLAIGPAERCHPSAARYGGAHPAARPAARRSRKFFWRRVLVVTMIAAVGAVAWSVAERAIASASGPAGPAPVACATGPVGLLPVPSGRDPGTCPRFYVARPGDTLWSIATRFAGRGDPRPLVMALEAQIGSGPLQPGERLTVP